MISKDMPSHGHRLELWIKELNLPARIIYPPPQFKLHSSINIKSPMMIYRAHEAWRYGITMDPSDEHMIVEWLDKASEFIRKKLMEA